MKKSFTFIFATLSAFILTFTSISIHHTVIAQAVTSGHYSYSISNNTATITEIDKAAGNVIIIPNKLDGYPVAKIGNYAFGKCSNITSVTFSESVEYINFSAFKIYSEPAPTVPDLDIFSDRTRLFSDSFSDYCNNLGTIIIKNSICTISVGTNTIPTNTIICGHDNSTAQTYAEKYNRTFVSIDGDIDDIIAMGYCGDYADWSLTRGGELKITGKGTMYNYNTLSDLPWFKYRGFIKSILIDNGITSVCDNAFYWCVNLNSVTIPESIIDLGNEAFSNCVSLQNITIGSNVTNIKNSTFNGCTALNTLTILNPNCLIDDTNTTIPTNCKIIGYDNSTARSYARKYNRTFELIDCTHSDANADGVCDLCKNEFDDALSLGDLDNDGNITSADARTALRAAVGLDTLTETQQKAADVNKDGILNSADARSILRCAVGLETF